MNNRLRIQMLILGLSQIVCFFAGYAFRAQDPNLAFVSAGVTTAFVLVVLLAARKLYPRQRFSAEETQRMHEALVRGLGDVPATDTRTVVTPINGMPVPAFVTTKHN